LRALILVGAEIVAIDHVEIDKVGDLPVLLQHCSESQNTDGRVLRQDAEGSGLSLFTVEFGDGGGTDQAKSHDHCPRWKPAFFVCSTRRRHDSRGAVEIPPDERAGSTYEDALLQGAVDDYDLNHDHDMRRASFVQGTDKVVAEVLFDSRDLPIIQSDIGKNQHSFMFDIRHWLLLLNRDDV
jgi:hypothetical protein